MPRSVDLAAGQALYLDNCAACHGADLTGQADWQSPGDDDLLPAPPHDATGHTWHHSDRALFDYTKLGGAAALEAAGVPGFNSGMPGFGDTLSDQDIWNVLAYIRSTWPEELQQYQAERTDADKD